MKEVVIRNFEFPQDYPRMRELWEGADMLGPERSSPTRMQEVAAVPDAAFVAEVHGEVVGGVYRTGALLQGLVVDPDFRRRGYGTLLLRRAERALRERGIEEAELIVDAAKTHQQAWYLREGYTQSFEGVGMTKDLAAVPAADTAAVDERPLPYQAFEEIYSRHCTGRWFITRVSTLENWLRSAPIPQFRTVVLGGGREDGDRLATSATMWHELREGKYRLWMHLAVGRIPLLKVVDSYTHNHCVARDPEGCYVYGDEEAGTLGSFEVTRSGISNLDPLKAEALYQSLADCVLGYRAQRAELCRIVDRSFRARLPQGSASRGRT
jgi:ribosomal protein S18 acetylase RimI-like enzyme